MGVGGALALILVLTRKAGDKFNELAALIEDAYAQGIPTVTWRGVSYDVNSIVAAAAASGMSVAEWLRLYGHV